MNTLKTPLDAWQQISDGIAEMIVADDKMMSDPNGTFEPKFDDAANRVMGGFQTLREFPDAMADVIGVMSAQPPTQAKTGATPFTCAKCDKVHDVLWGRTVVCTCGHISDIPQICPSAGGSRA